MNNGVKLSVAFIILLALLMSTTIDAQVRVRGYFRKDGTYVAPHYRSSPNSTKLDNWSTKGNINPYTGEVGAIEVDELQSASPSPSPDENQKLQESPASTNSSSIGSLPKNSSEQVTVPSSPARDESRFEASSKMSLEECAFRILALESRLENIEAMLKKLTNTSSTMFQVPPSLSGWRKLQRGMSKEQVRALLGEPRRISGGASENWDYADVSYHSYVNFYHDTLNSWTEPE